MARITERELILPALYLMSIHPEISTSELIVELAEIFRPTGEDAAILAGRSDTKFSQIVRNLVAHKTLDVRTGFAIYDRRGNNGYFSITGQGREFLESNQDSLMYLLTRNDMPYQELVIGVAAVQQAAEQKRQVLPYNENAIVVEGHRYPSNSHVTERSQALREAAIRYYTVNDHIACAACSFDFWQVYGEVGRGYIEIHHRVPLFQYADQDTTIFLREAIERVAPLCSNCHRMIHRNRNQVLEVEELRDMIAAQR